MLFKLTGLQKILLRKIAQKYQLKMIILFGSVAKGKEKKESDLDIGVAGLVGLDFTKQLSLMADLNKMFGRKIDLSFVERANPLLLHQICLGGKLLYGSQRDFSRLKLYAFHRFNDYTPYFKREEQLVKKAVFQINKKHDF